MLRVENTHTSLNQFTEQKKTIKSNTLKMFFNYILSKNMYRRVLKYHLLALTYKPYKYRIRSPYLFKMARLAFSSYIPKKIIKKKRKNYTKKFRRIFRKIYKILTFGFLKKIKRVRKKLRIKISMDRHFLVKKRLFFVGKYLRAIRWRYLSNKINNSFRDVGINAYISFRRLSFMSAPASFYANYILKALKNSKNPVLSMIIRPMNNRLEFSDDVAAVKIHISGRYTRNQRATSSNFGFGSVPYGSIQKKVDFSKKVYNARFGSTSLRVLIKYEG